MADEATIRWSEKSSVLAPAYDAFAVTPSDSVNYTTSSSSNAIARALYIGTAGNVVLVTERGNVATFANLTTSFILPVCHKRVNSTNTTASGLVALY